MIGSTSAGNERLAVLSEIKKPVLSTVARAGNERLAVLSEIKKPVLSTVARAGSESMAVYLKSNKPCLNDHCKDAGGSLESGTETDAYRDIGVRVESGTETEDPTVLLIVKQCIAYFRCTVLCSKSSKYAHCQLSPYV